MKTHYYYDAKSVKSQWKHRIITLLCESKGKNARNLESLIAIILLSEQTHFQKGVEGQES